MRKTFIIALLVMTLFAGQLFADGVSSGSTVTIASVVNPPQEANPSIILGIGSAELSYYMSPDVETTAITGINLMEDGSFTFALMTSEEVYISRGSVKMAMTVEIEAEGFHRYDYNYTGFLEGSSMDEANIQQRNAVPLLDNTPRIDIPQFYGSNENITVSHIGDDNRIEIRFNEGTTKAELIIGTFKVEWKGQRPLEAGIYKAKVSVIYSTP